MDTDLIDLLDTADRIVAADLHPERLRKIIADLSAVVREQSVLVKESREYGAALVQELKDRATKHDLPVALATSMDADFEAFVDAVKALGAMPEGYCFCSANRIGDDSKMHEPECADIRKKLDGGSHAR